MPKKTIKKTIKKTESEPLGSVQTKPYHARLRIMGKTYESSGSNIIEVMSNFKILGNIKSYGLLRVTRPATENQIELTREKIVPARFLSQFFNGSRIMKEFALKNISIMFNL